jgi:hypothetical protein
LECISPDGKYAVHRFQNEQDNESQSEIVSLPERTKVQGLPSEMQGAVLWSPDSKAIAYTSEETPRFTYVVVCRKDGDVFQKSGWLETFPGAELAESGWPKGWKAIGGGRAYLAPRRWVAADTLEIRGSAYEKLVQKEDDLQEMWAVKVNFTAKLGTKPGALVTSKPVVIFKGFEPSGENVKVPKEFAAAVPDASQWAYSPDKAFVLVSPAKAVVKLVALKGEKKGKVTEIEAEVKKLFAADYKACQPAATDAELPFAVVDLAGFDADWVFQGKDEIALQCEATTNKDGDHYKGMWCARLDAVWSISQGKFTSQKVTRGAGGK